VEKPDLNLRPYMQMLTTNGALAYVLHH